MSVSCPADTRFDAFGEPSISPEDEDYTYVDIRNPRLFFRPKHKQLDSDSDGDGKCLMEQLSFIKAVNLLLCAYANTL